LTASQLWYHDAPREAFAQEPTALAGLWPTQQAEFLGYP